VPLWNPKLATAFAARVCELRVPGTSEFRPMRLCWIEAWNPAPKGITSLPLAPSTTGSG
jgi:hypothetical protein